MLVRLRMSAKKIKRAVLEVDDEALTVDDLAMLARTIPSAEEVSCWPTYAQGTRPPDHFQSERLKALEGDLQKLAKPDLYFREVSSDSNLAL